MADTPGRTIYENQLNFFAAKDADRLVQNNYNDDALLTSFDFTVRGCEALRSHFQGFFEMAGDIKLKSTDRFVETEDTVIVEATVETSRLGEVVFVDAFVMKDGKICYQFTIVK